MSYTFNISSDLFMLAVPVPLLIQAQLPWKRYVQWSFLVMLGLVAKLSIQEDGASRSLQLRYLRRTFLLIPNLQVFLLG